MTIARRLALALVLVVASAPASWAQTVDELLDKSIAAMGGRAAFEKIKTRVMTGTISLSTPAGDIPGTIEVVNALPNKARTVIKADLSAFGAGPLVIDQRFDGQAGHVSNTLQGDTAMTGNQLDNMRNSGFPHLYLTYKALGIKATLQGKEKVADREAYVINFEPAAGSVMKQYIDAQTMMPFRLVMKVSAPQVGEFEQTTDATDFRDVDGIKIPFKLATSSSAQSYTVELSKVEHNGPVDDKQFVKP